MCIIHIDDSDNKVADDVFNDCPQSIGENYDFIYGPVANDDVYTTFTLYTAGVLSKEQTIEALKVKKLYNQLVLTSEKALSFLKFIGTVPKEEF